MNNAEKQDFQILFKGYLNETLGPDELETFFILCERPENSLIIQAHFEDYLSNHKTDLSTPGQSEAAWEKLQFNLEKNSAPVRSIQPAMRWVAAAVVFILATFAIYLFRKPATLRDAVSSNATVKAPKWLTAEHMGGTLYLSGGDSLALNKQDSGMITRQGGLEVIQSGGSIRYAGNETAALYNELRTGRGKLWRVLLPDQTIVWLNSSSSIRYPLNMDQGLRSVEISGEVYFEVAHRSTQSFQVKSAGQIVEDIGTTFNIQYTEEDKKVRTTLVEGSVLVKTTGKEATLHPGEQTTIRAGQSDIQIQKNVNLDAALAWKNGRFYFQNARLHAVMRQIADWYHVDVIYQGPESKELFNGQIEKTLSLSQVLQGIQQPGVQFTLDSLHRIVVRQR